MNVGGQHIVLTWVQHINAIWDLPLFFMPPTSKKLRGHIGLGLSVQWCPVMCSESVMHE